MNLRTLILATTLPALAACTTGTPPSVPQGEISIGGVTYPLVARGDQWFVRTDVGLVQCLHPTERDCYWSLRAWLLSRRTPEGMG